MSPSLALPCQICSVVDENEPLGTQNYIFKSPTVPEVCAFHNAHKY
jgi:hypothetical protein